MPVIAQRSCHLGIGTIGRARATISVKHAFGLTALPRGLPTSQFILNRRGFNYLISYSKFIPQTSYLRHRFLPELQFYSFDNSHYNHVFTSCPTHPSRRRVRNPHRSPRQTTHCLWLGSRCCSISSQTTAGRKNHGLLGGRPKNLPPIILLLLTHKLQVLHEDSPKAKEWLSLHLSKNPEEATALQNKAGSTPPTFHPVGHISLNFSDEPDLVDHSLGLFCISEFFISHQLQGSGVGAAAISALENIAKAAPINAKTLSLRCRSALTERGELEACYRDIGQELPMEVEGWYGRRGYVVVGTKEEGIRHAGGERVYRFLWSYMRKEL